MKLVEGAGNHAAVERLSISGVKGELLVIIYSVFPGSFLGSHKIAFLSPDGRLINLTDTKARVAGRYLVRCAEAVAS